MSAIPHYEFTHTDELVDLINILRKEKGYSIKKLAQMAKVSRSYLKAIMRGDALHPSERIVKKICEALEVPYEEFEEAMVLGELKKYYDTTISDDY
jgi:transcriptional regulator with XRE-family HTH domain